MENRFILKGMRRFSVCAISPAGGRRAGTSGSLPWAGHRACMNGLTYRASCITPKKGTADVMKAADTALNAGEKEAPNYDILSAAFDTATCKLRKEASMTVVTTDDVKVLKVTDKKGKKINADITSVIADGQITWKVSVKMTNAGNQAYTVTGYGLDGTAGDSANAAIRVTRK